jgi:hypothetical protein
MKAVKAYASVSYRDIAVVESFLTEFIENFNDLRICITEDHAQFK